MQPPPSPPHTVLERGEGVENGGHLDIHNPPLYHDIPVLLTAVALSYGPTPPPLPAIALGSLLHQF